jgi:hypothetical protein
MGGIGNDQGLDIGMDPAGNIFVTGLSTNSWGSPLNPHSSGWYDILVAGLDNNGDFLWNTFYGDGGYDYNLGLGVAADGRGSVYVAGFSMMAWGTPLNDFAGGLSDSFLLCLEAPFLGFTVRARVNGEGGRVIPKIQRVLGDENAKISILPDPDYRINTIEDNGVFQPINNPYTINHVNENHHIVVTFDHELYPPEMILIAKRKTEQAWIVNRDYAQIELFITEHPQYPMPVSKYMVVRTHGNNQKNVAEYKNSGSFQIIDKFLEKGEPYTYQIVCLDDTGKVIAVSDKATI